ncbi:uncharacterized protein M2139_002263 [Enterococcus sp. PF1-24]|uniref:YceD family protein n=1 Tax=unclassified Enterococcus TaxID=2608891 RepID=UPI0024740B27|nr:MULTISPECIES: YceD family protein [unclassified Enterococcus]MDH6365261.1 uncharacterized protein [Enterococcus sp. PFB1-1]MDH6402362.1 uncharacterized protein [Enterococcus sp. PF1-24]
MKWSLLELRKFQEEPLTFAETIDLKENLMNRDATILDVQPVVVDGLVTVSKGEYIVHYTISTTLTLPSSRSLTPVEYPLQLTVDEVFMTTEQYRQRNDLIPEEDIILLEADTIDLDISVADNILLAIPVQIFTAEEETATDLPKGSGWQVLSEADYHQQKEQAADTIDPRLAKLSELFSPEEDSE